MTKHEKYIITFLLFIALLGIGLRFYKNTSNQAILKSPIPQSLLERPAVINVNRASKEDLIALKGIGPKLASRIIEYRKENGNFSKKEDLKKVRGIGPAKFEDIKEYIKVE